MRFEFFLSLYKSGAKIVKNVPVMRAQYKTLFFFFFLVRTNEVWTLIFSDVSCSSIIEILCQYSKILAPQNGYSIRAWRLFKTYGNVPTWNTIAHTAKHVKRSHGMYFIWHSRYRFTRAHFLLTQKKAVNRCEQIARRTAMPLWLRIEVRDTQCDLK